MDLVLYGTEGCHLCEQARELVVRVRGARPREVDIADDAELMARYGVHIPVLRDAVSGAELGWPFDTGELARWLAQAS